MKFAFVTVLLVSLWTSLSNGQERPGKMIVFEMVIADLVDPLDSPTAEKILEIEKSGKFNFLTRVQVTSLEEQTASVQFGEATSRSTGRAAAGRGFAGGPFGGRGALPTYTSLNVGTSVELTARVEQDGSIVTQLRAERSGLGAAPEQPVEVNGRVPPESVERLMTETTLRLKPGEPQLVGGRQGTTGKDANKTWIVLTAHLGHKPAPAAK